MMQIFKKLLFSHPDVEPLISLFCEWLKTYNISTMETCIQQIPAEIMIHTLEKKGKVDYEVAFISYYALLHQYKFEARSSPPISCFTYSDITLSHIPIREVLGFARIKLATTVYPKLVGLIATKYPEYYQTDSYLIEQDQFSDSYLIDSFSFDANGLVVVTTDNVLETLELLLRRSNECNFRQLDIILGILNFLLSSNQPYSFTKNRNKSTLCELFKELWLHLFSFQPKQLCIRTLNVFGKSGMNDLSYHDLLYSSGKLIRYCKPLCINHSLLSLTLQMVEFGASMLTHQIRSSNVSKS